MTRAALRFGVNSPDALQRVPQVDGGFVVGCLQGWLAAEGREVAFVGVRIPVIERGSVGQ